MANVVEIPLMGYVWNGYADMVANYLTDRKKAKALDAVELTIMSDGGSAWDGIAAYDAIKAVGVSTSAFVIGKAHSAASLYLMAADKDKRVATPNATFLLHNPASTWTDGRGTAADHAMTAEILQQVEDIYVAIYAKETNMSESDIRALMANEKVVTAQEALDLGIISEIRETIDKQMSVYAGFSACATNFEPKNLTDMDFKTLIAEAQTRLGLGVASPTADVQAAAVELSVEQRIAAAVEAKEAEFTAELQAYTASVDAKLAALAAELKAATDKNAELQAQYDRVAQANARQNERNAALTEAQRANHTSAPVAGIEANANATQPDMFANNPYLQKLRATLK